MLAYLCGWAIYVRRVLVVDTAGLVCALLCEAGFLGRFVVVARTWLDFLWNIGLSEPISHSYTLLGHVISKWGARTCSNK